MKPALLPRDVLQIFVILGSLLSFFLWNRKRVKLKIELSICSFESIKNPDGTDTSYPRIGLRIMIAKKDGNLVALSAFYLEFPKSLRNDITFGKRFPQLLHESGAVRMYHNHF